MIRVIVTGAAGRMGGRVLALAKEAGDFRIVGATERPGHTAIGQDVGEVAGIGAVGVKVADGLAKIITGADVVIDFTAPEASIDHLREASKAGVAIVVGTTGLTKEHLAEARRLAAHIACVISPNMSVGVNVLFKVLREVARTLGDDYDVEIVEAHHHFKKDAPSGTALRMAQVVAEALGRDLEQVGIYGRKGIVGERPQAQIGVHTVRAGDIVGEHTVLFGGMGERIEIGHRAHSRDNFARGALRAARFVAQAPKGIYDMADVLGLT
ncbi:MAG: dihydrodipicolinate reductase (DHPR) [candidate division NC10 bacterium CSP1-5]|nr:MAG: dihydrodipicolinate reductase (DHPR) [candidate division NC10 bacterium CSP1-5]